MANLIQLSPVQSEKTIHAWTMNDQKVDLLKKGNTLRLKVIDVTTKKESFYPIRNVLETDKIISFLTSCDVFVEKDKRPYFFKPWKWTVGQKEVSLVFSRTNDLMCQIFDKKTNKSIQYDALECLAPSYRCHEDTIERIEEIKTESIEKILSFMEGFTVSHIIDHDLSERDHDSEYSQKYAAIQALDQKNHTNYLKTVGMGMTTILSAMAFPPLFIPGIIILGAGSLNLSGNLYKQHKVFENIQSNNLLQLKRNADRIDTLKSSAAPFLVEIEPISEKSRIDDKVRVSKFMWAVTSFPRGGQRITMRVSL